MNSSNHFPAPHQPAAGEETPYHRAALFYPRLQPRPQGQAHARRRPIRALVFALILSFVAQILVFIAATLAAALVGTDVDTTVLSEDPNNATSNIVLLLSLASMVPVCFVAARTAGYQSRFLLSIVGRMRWGIVGVAAGISLAVAVVGQVIAYACGEGLEPRTPEHQDVILLGAVIVLVPFQAAAEEIFARGFLPQIFGCWFKSPWVAYLPGALLWICLHGYNSWGTVAIAYSAVLYAVLVHKTGGLEAVIAIHTINNYLAFAQPVFSVVEDPNTIPWEAALFDMAGTTLIVVLVYFCVRRLVFIPTPPRPHPVSPQPQQML
ncbi:CPBP family intramembrane glutamic endopeptidase [Corynebacterium auriscanis]|uniref:CPBP family intramembrane glutamic endopeptidase n=1 Tax=Corynebacterium auriscanis TaxID=99807 RepID=UPI003CEAD5C8